MSHRAESFSIQLNTSICNACSVVLLISGGIMYGVCKDDERCGGNPSIAHAGYIMMIVGGALMGLSLLLCFCFCCIGVFCISKANNKDNDNVFKNINFGTSRQMTFV